MIKVDFQTTYITIGTVDFPINSLTVEVNESYETVRLSYANSGRVAFDALHYSQWINASNEPYDSLNDLVTDLRQAFVA